MKREVSRLYLRNEKSFSKKFVHIVALYEGGLLKEYKFTLEGLPGSGAWSFMADAAFDSVKGIRRRGITHKLQANIEIGYHRDGNIMYKSGKNFKPKKGISFGKLTKKPEPFLKIVGFSLQELESRVGEAKENESVLELKGYGSTKKIACLFHIAKGKHHYSFKPSDPDHFKKAETISLYDDTNDISFHLLFHLTEHKEGLVVMIQPRRTLFLKVYYFFLYRFYEFKEKLMSTHRNN